MLRPENIPNHQTWDEPGDAQYQTLMYKIHPIEVGLFQAHCSYTLTI